MSVFTVSTSPPREQAPAGVYFARAVGLYDIGTQAGGEYGSKRQLVVEFELIGSEDSKGKPFKLSKFYTLSFNEKANLRKDVESWTGQVFKGNVDFELEKLLSVPCQVSVVHVEKRGGGARESIKTIMSCPKGMAVPQPTSDVVTYEVDTSRPIDSAVPKWVQNFILKSEEWVAAHGETHIENAPPAKGTGHAFSHLAPAPGSFPNAATNSDEDIPF